MVDLSLGGDEAQSLGADKIYGVQQVLLRFAETYIAIRSYTQ